MDGSGPGIAIYSRKSKFTGKGESIGNQIELCREYVRTVYGTEWGEKCVIFEDEGFSGGNLNRPDFRAMMDGVRKHRFRAIVVYRLDRISRNISDFANLIDELTRLGVSFVSIREQFDTGTPMGRAMMFIISVFSQLERETIAERIRDNMHELAKSGRWLGGNTPTGYGSESVSNVTVDGKTRKACKLKLIPREAEVVRTIFDLYTRTDSLSATEAELLRRRLKTKKGNDFTRFSVKAILQNPVYMMADEDARRYLEEKGVFVYADLAAFDGEHGMMVYNRTDQEKGRAAEYLPMTEWIVSVGKHPGLIPAAQWISVQQSLARNKSKAYGKPRSNRALLTGLLFCGCGGRMYPKLTGRRTESGDAVFSYVCKMKERSKGAQCACPNLDGNGADAAVFDRIQLLSGDPRRFREQMGKSRKLYEDTRDQSESQRTRLRWEISENEKRIESLVDSISEAEEPEVKLRIRRRIGQLSQENLELGQRLRELEEGNRAGGSAAEYACMLGKLKELCRSMGAMDVEEKRGAVRSVVQKIVWDGETVQVYFHGAP